MAVQTLGQELDVNPLVGVILDKTRVGKLNWQATAADNTFITSVGGETTLQVTLESFDTVDAYGQPDIGRAPVLRLLDSKGRKLWETSESEVKGGLWPLYKLAQRIANKIDDRVAGIIETLQKL